MKKIISFICVLAMVITMLPVTAEAAADSITIGLYDSYDCDRYFYGQRAARFQSSDPNVVKIINDQMIARIEKTSGLQMHPSKKTVETDCDKPVIWVGGRSDTMGDHYGVNIRSADLRLKNESAVNVGRWIANCMIYRNSTYTGEILGSQNLQSDTESYFPEYLYKTYGASTVNKIIRKINAENKKKGVTYSGGMGISPKRCLAICKSYTSANVVKEK